MSIYPGEIFYFAFTPETSGFFTVRSYGTLAAMGYLYNSSLSQLASNTNGAGAPNFLIGYQLTAGVTYIIGVKLTSATATGEFNIQIYNG